MKKLLFIVLLSLGIVNSNAQNESKMENQKIQAVIRDYAAAVDAQNVTEAEKFMDIHFRVVLTNLNNSGVTTILSREQYTGMMRAGKVGGSKRQLTFLLTDIHQPAAIVKVKLEGEKNVFTNYFSLVKTDDQWLIAQDIPQIQSKPTN
jgi:aldose sugar dehydrogenase